MIVVQLMGGLGNQMFQYALGRSLAERRGDTLFLDATQLCPEKIDPRFNRQIFTYGLDVFNIQANLTSVQELRQDKVDIIWTISEVGFGFFPDVLTESQYHKNIGLIGWWQSEAYFKDVAGIIQNDFTFTSNYRSRHDLSLIARIETSDSVCLHIRRTDYLHKLDTKGFIGVDYYKKALDLIADAVKQPELFIFSDDIAWCEENLAFPFPATFVRSPQSDRDHAADDFYLMTRCKYFIIANSTYSWWAAWLARYSNKLVIAPQMWFRAERPETIEESHLLSHDLIPEQWIRA